GRSSPPPVRSRAPSGASASWSPPRWPRSPPSTWTRRPPSCSPSWRRRPPPAPTDGCPAPYAARPRTDGRTTGRTGGPPAALGRAGAQRRSEAQRLGPPLHLGGVRPGQRPHRGAGQALVVPVQPVQRLLVAVPGVPQQRDHSRQVLEHGTVGDQLGR